MLWSTHFSVTPIFHSSPNHEDDELLFSTGFKTGFIRWDDENSDNNNNYRGAMPDGKFTKNTLIEYCCRTDGHSENDIILPTDTPFVLFKSNSISSVSACTRNALEGGMVPMGYRGLVFLWKRKNGICSAWGGRKKY